MVPPKVLAFVEGESQPMDRGGKSLVRPPRPIWMWDAANDGVAAELLAAILRGRRRVLGDTHVHCQADVASRIVGQARMHLAAAEAIAHVVTHRNFAHLLHRAAALHFARHRAALDL